jgi:hypothetical protein
MKAFFENGAILALVWAGFLPASDSWAQVYRCGKVYQDRPCEGAQPGKAMTGLGASPKAADSSPAASPGTAANPVCVRRGTDSQKIVWSREAGATEEKLLSEESNAARRQLISDVYRVRGTAPQVRARIEAECHAEMAEKARAAAAYEALLRSGAAPGRSAAPAGPAAEKRAAEAKLKAQEAEQRTAAAQKIAVRWL